MLAIVNKENCTDILDTTVLFVKIYWVFRITLKPEQIVAVSYRWVLSQGKVFWIYASVCLPGSSEPADVLDTIPQACSARSSVLAHLLFWKPWKHLLAFLPACQCESSWKDLGSVLSNCLKTEAKEDPLCRGSINGSWLSPKAPYAGFRALGESDQCQLEVTSWSGLE